MKIHTVWQMGYFWNQTLMPIQSSGAVWPASNVQQGNEQGQAAGFHLALQHVFGGAAQPARIMTKNKEKTKKLERRLQISLWKLNFTTIQRQAMLKIWARVRLHVTYTHLFNADCRLCTADSSVQHRRESIRRGAQYLTAIKTASRVTSAATRN